MATREELSAQLDELKPALQRTLEAERSKVVSAGKPWDMTAWILGMPIDQRYPQGPAYLPLPGHTTFLSLTMGITLKDWAYTAAATGFLYMWGYKYNQPVFKVSGHRLGLMISVPMVFLGWGSGFHRSYLRHHGYMPNGQPSRYPGYQHDATPYLVKHKSGDRHGPIVHAEERVYDHATAAAAAAFKQ